MAHRPMIWINTSSPPQHIGYADPDKTLRETIAGAREAGWRVYGGIRKPGGDRILFDTRERLTAWADRNPAECSLIVTDAASAGVEPS